MFVMHVVAVVIIFARAAGESDNPLVELIRKSLRTKLGGFSFGVVVE